MSETIIKKPDALYDEFFRRPGDDKTNTHYCPGCGHGIIHKLIAEAMDELGIAERCVFVSPVGCSVSAYYYFDCGNVQAAHGRAPAVGTGITRANPDNIVISYQGDGDLAAIGTAEIIHAANRGEKMTVFFVNNAIYGMTGGQMAPTSLLGQKTATSPFGRSYANEGPPLKMAEVISTLDAPVYVTRCSVHDIKNIMKTRKIIKKALKTQLEGGHFSFVEILSSCPVNWKIPATSIQQWMEEHMLPYFPLGVFQDKTSEPAAGETIEHPHSTVQDLLDLGRSAIPPAQVRPAFTNLKVLIAGFGGQGILLLGSFIARTGMLHGYSVTWLPSYGPEMRGGTAFCSVVLDADTVGFPVVEEPDVLICMNSPSVKKFANTVAENGVIIYNASIIDASLLPEDRRSIPVRASELAKDAGSERAANAVMLGAFYALFSDFNKETMTSLVEEQFAMKKGLVPVNITAFESGAAAVQRG